MISLSSDSPCGWAAKPCVTAGSNSSLVTTSEMMTRTGSHWLPILEDGKLLGVLTQSSLLSALSQGADPHAPVYKFVECAATIQSHESMGQALRRTMELGAPLCVTDQMGHFVGYLAANHFFEPKTNIQRPSPVGGMATIFGVYLTSGAAKGGKHGWNLVLTGTILFLFLFLGNTLCTILASQFPPDQLIQSAISGAGPIAIMAATFWLSPLAGYHAAEHQTVHAIEQGEPLVPEVVARMSRVHPRCGTNLAVGMTLFLAIFQYEWVSDEELRLLVAVIITLFAWRPLGSLVQKYVTTRPATQKQLASGIAAAQELLKHHATVGNREANAFVRICNSGMLQVMLGSLLAYSVIAIADSVFKLNIPGL